MEFRSHYSGSTGNLYSVTEGDRRLLIEAGVSLPKIRKALNFRLSEYGDCLVSHSHLDHSNACADLMKAGVNVHCTKETAEALGLSGHRLKTVVPDVRFGAGDFQILPFSTEHDCWGSVGFLVMSPTDKALFLTDSFYVRYRFPGLTIIAIECNWSHDTLSDDIAPSVKRRLLTSHFSLEHVKDFLASNDLSKVREIHLLHLSNDNSNAEAFVDDIQRTTGKPVFAA